MKYYIGRGILIGSILSFILQIIVFLTIGMKIHLASIIIIVILLVVGNVMTDMYSEHGVLNALFS